MEANKQGKHRVRRCRHLPSPLIMEDGAEASAAKQKYVASSQELANAISTLENSLIAFTGREEGIKVLPCTPLVPLTAVLSQTFHAWSLVRRVRFSLRLGRVWSRSSLQAAKPVMQRGSAGM